MMTEPIWNQFLTERDKQVFGEAGYGARAGFGKRPAVLVIDVNYAFCGESPEPIIESIKKWRNSGGEDAWVSIGYIRQLLDAAHAKGVPCLYTTGVRREDNWDSGSWSWKNSRSGEDKPVVRANRNAILWSKLGFQNTLPGIFVNNAANTPDGYTRVENRHDKADVPTNIHEDMAAGLAIRTVPAHLAAAAQPRPSAG